jgi:MYXO-CTERM domain-containing protein
MRKSHLLSALLLASSVGLAREAEAAVTLQLVGPRSNTPFDQKVSISAIVTSDWALKSVTARIGTQSVDLRLSGSRYEADFPLAGQPKGPLTLTVTATDAYDATASAQANVFYDDLPVITAIHPRSFVRSDLHVDATCTTTGVSPCTSISVTSRPDVTYTTRPATPVAGLTVAGTHVVGDLLNLPEGAVPICFTARTAYGLGREVCMRVAVDRSPRLVEVLSAGDGILDVDDTRVLYFRCPLVGASCTTWIRDRVTSVDTLLPTLTSQGWSDYIKLTPLGAIGCRSEWRAGTLYPVYDPSVPNQIPCNVAVGGTTAIWRSGLDLQNSIHIRDTVTGAQIDRYVREVDAGLSVSPSGDAFFTQWVAGRSFHVMRYHAGVISQVTTKVSGYVNPVSDDVNVVYGLWSYTTGESKGVGMIDPSGVVSVVASGTALSASRPTYAVAAGKVAYTRAMGLPGAEVFVRLPSGTTSLVAPWTTGYSAVEPIDATDRVIHLHGTSATLVDRYEARAGIPMERISTGIGTIKLLGGQWHVIMGNTVLRIVDPPSSGTDAGANEAGASDAGANEAGASDSGTSTDAGAPGAPTEAGLPDGGEDGSPASPDSPAPLGPVVAAPAGDGETSPDAPGDSCSTHGSATGSALPFALVVVAAALRRRRR